MTSLGPGVLFVAVSQQPIRPYLQHTVGHIPLIGNAGTYLKITIFVLKDIQVSNFG